MNLTPNPLKQFLPLLGSLGLVVFAPLAFSQTNEPDSSAEEGIVLNFRNVPIEMVLDHLSEAAGFVIVTEVDVTGRISVWNRRPMSPDDAVSALDSILHEKGFAAIRSGNVLKIVAQSSAKTENLPVKKGNNPEEIPLSDSMITQIIPVLYADAPQLIQDLQPLVPENMTVTSNQSSNALVITGTQSQIRRFVEIIQALDNSISGISRVRVFQLKFADAKELATVVKGLFEEGQTSSRRSSSSSRGGGGPPSFFERFRGGSGGDSGSDRGNRSTSSNSEARQAATRVVAVADERTNSLVVSAPDELIPTIEQLVEEIDTNVADITELKVFPLQHADAAEMSQILNNLFDEESQNQNQSSSRFSRGSFFRGPDSSRSSSSDGNAESRRSQAESKVVALPDPRTNSIIVSASSHQMKQIELMIKQLDSDSSKKQKVFVYSLQHADVDSVAGVLRGMFESQNSMNNRSTTSRTGQNNNNPLNNRTVGGQNQGIGGGGNGGRQGF